jgi:lipopolysaccharide assembly protein A
VSFTRSGDAPERGAGETPPVEPAPGLGTPEPTPEQLLEQPPEPTPQPAGEPGEVPSTRTGTAFKALIAGAIVLILLLVFILENTERVKITYFGAGGHLPLGVALLIAAVGGALLAGIVGTARIFQLRRHVRRHRL